VSDRKPIDQAEGFAHRRKCTHRWQPVSFAFECEMYSIRGSEIRVPIRQPDLVGGRVYCVCMKCASHTYIATQWAGFYLGGDRDPEEEE
jgi:hypothetical protein